VRVSWSYSVVGADDAIADYLPLAIATTVCRDRRSARPSFPSDVVERRQHCPHGCGTTNDALASPLGVETFRPDQLSEAMGVFGRLTPHLVSRGLGPFGRITRTPDAVRR
jgi:hypothetical protein